MDQYSQNGTSIALSLEAYCCLMKVSQSGRRGSRDNTGLTESITDVSSPSSTIEAVHALTLRRVGHNTDVSGFQPNFRLP